MQFGKTLVPLHQQLKTETTDTKVTYIDDSLYSFIIETSIKNQHLINPNSGVRTGGRGGIGGLSRHGGCKEGPSRGHRPAQSRIKDASLTLKLISCITLIYLQTNHI